MQFGSVPVETAAGAILAHGVRAGETRFKKGKLLSAADVALLKRSGVKEVTIARVESADVAEDLAAARLAAGCAGEGVRIGAAFTGRVNLYAVADGIAVVDASTVNALNAINEAITLATIGPFARIAKGQMLATIKIIPFAAPRVSVEAAEALMAGRGGLVSVRTFRPHAAALISTVLPDTKPSLLDKSRSALADRLKPLGSSISFERRVPHSIAELAAAIQEAAGTSCDPILIFGASAITDRRDVIPAAVEMAGGTIEQFGMPVDPGNLLLLGRKGGRIVVGLPSCARSPKLNGFDFVLWRLLSGLPVGPSEIAAMGVGGLLNEIPTRPQPRDERQAEAPQLPRIAAIVLAAGLSSRMGTNKLLTSVRGKPLVRHAVEAAMASSAQNVIVVTGNGAAEVEQALSPLTPLFVKNHDYSKGLSSSLRSGLGAVPQDCDGALVALADMPGVTAVLLDRLIAAFNPGEDRAICVPTRNGKRGNPVLWARRFFPEMMALEGDVGARHLIGQYSELVCEVEADDDGPLTDIDTPQMLAEYPGR
jgi:molybdenum cofactor cytidylyltransferase